MQHINVTCKLKTKEIELLFGSAKKSSEVIRNATMTLSNRVYLLPFIYSFSIKIGNFPRIQQSPIIVHGLHLFAYCFREGSHPSVHNDLPSLPIIPGQSAISSARG